MKIKTVIENVRLKINDTDKFRFLDYDILNVVNDGIRFIRNIFLDQYPDLLVDDVLFGTLETEENQIELPFIPARYVDVRVNGERLRGAILQDIDDLLAMGQPKKYCIVGKGKIRVFPIPKEYSKYSVVAVPVAQDVGLDDESPFLDDFNDCLVEFVALRLSMIDEFDQSQETTLLQQISNNVITKIQKINAPTVETVRGYYD